MDNKDYRLNLAHKIAEEPDETKRREILAEAKKTDEYEREFLKHKGIAFEALIQEQAPWLQFDDENIDENFKRKPATVEQRENMDKRLVALGQMFSGSDINWHLDGAFNISLMNKEYIGNHKDVDLSVEKNDLQKLEEQLFKNGYGLFLSESDDKTKNRVMRRIGYKNIEETKMGHPLIAAMNKNGEILEDKPLNYIDLHIVERNSQGQLIGKSGAVIPEKWAKPYPVEFQGKKINLSHPGKVLYYKLHQGRGYDLTDIQKLIKTGELEGDDIKDIENVFDSEYIKKRESVAKVLEPVIKQITPGMNNEKIFELLMRQPDLSEKDEMKESFHLFAYKIAEADKKSAEAIVDLALELFGIKEREGMRREELKKIEKSIKDAKKLEEVRKEIL